MNSNSFLRISIVVCFFLGTLSATAHDLLTYEGPITEDQDDERSSCKCFSNVVVTCALAANSVAIGNTLTVGGRATFTGPLLGNGPNGLAPAGLFGFGYVYDLTTQTVAANADVTFSVNGGLYNVAHTVATAPITLVNSGTYLVQWIVTVPSAAALLTDQFALYLGPTPYTAATQTAVAGTTFEALLPATLTAGGAFQISGTSIIGATAGQVLTLRNVGAAGITLVTTAATSTGASASADAAINIVRIA